jgi:hypothetical protein
MDEPARRTGQDAHAYPLVTISIEQAGTAERAAMTNGICFSGTGNGICFSGTGNLGTADAG